MTTPWSRIITALHPELSAVLDIGRFLKETEFTASLRYAHRRGAAPAGAR